MKKVWLLMLCAVLTFLIALPVMAFGTMDLDYSLFMNNDIWGSSVSSHLVGWNLGFQDGAYLSNITYFGGFFGGNGANEGFYRFFGASMGYAIFQNDKNYLAAIVGYGRTVLEASAFSATSIQGIFFGVQGYYGFSDNFAVSGRAITASFGSTATYGGVEMAGDSYFNLAEIQGRYLFTDEWGVFMGLHWAQMKIPGTMNEIFDTASMGVSYSF